MSTASPSQQKSKAKLHPEWLKVLGPEFDKPYMQELRGFLMQEKKLGKTIYPEGPKVFEAFNLTPFSKVKVVIIGQDPYHGENQAHGLSFSVKPGIGVPPSLVNIYKELKYDLGLEHPGHGFLESWAKQGVLLLNAVLTVEKGKAASHQKKGWEEFTDQAIMRLSEEREHLVFILWGSYAQKKGAYIDRSKHLVLESPHPSPLAAHRGFFGTRPFSQANRYLVTNDAKPVDWTLH
ncbi:MAG: uracil-DNA glycosylase [Oligoflexales bacterium]|nr:uracil-DNA glycosylase [Oligoflexales bacterium]